jgi:uncharacterized protein YjgD (DUF1641 family)
MTTAVIESPASVAATAAQSASTSLDEIGRKLDALTLSMESLNQRVEWLTEQAFEQRSRQREWEELREDVTPIIHEAYTAAVEQMQTLEHHVQLEDVQLLVMRLLRNTRNLNQVLDWLESGMDLTHDFNRMSREIMTAATETLQEMEEKGYFGFIRQSAYVMDRIVTSFSEDDVKQLGDNVVLILNTVKALTQPEMMNLVSSLTQGLHEAEVTVTDDDIRLMSLMRQMRDPDVRRGLAVTLATLKRMSQPPAAPG